MQSDSAQTRLEPVLTECNSFMANGENILSKMKVWEFHVQESINCRIRQIGDKGLCFQTLNNKLKLINWAWSNSLRKK